MQNENIDRHFTGSFNVDGEEITGELIYNKEKGVIMINLVKQLTEAPIGKHYSNLDVITGKLNSGTIVTLFHNHCTKNYTKNFRIQQLVFLADYAIWSISDATNKKYNKLKCVLENALGWSGLSCIDTSDFSVIKFKGNENGNIYHWFGAKITFSTSLKCEVFNFPHKEESKIVERLVVHIEADEKKEISYFTNIRNKVISLISFAIKNNVNIEEQYLYNYEDSYQIGEHTEYYKHYLYTKEQRLYIYSGSLYEYNFMLGQLSPEKDIQNELILLEPIFNLYLSLFKYENMPPEMVFLNIVQGLETFHARFYYEDSKDKYVASVIERFGNHPKYLDIKNCYCVTHK